MRKWVLPFLVLASSILFGLYAGCKKGGPTIPYDLPIPTATPNVGAINVFVLDGATPVPVASVTIQLVDPMNNTSTSVTSKIYGVASFNPPILTQGLWKAIVPTQGRYAYSSFDFQVTGSGVDSVTFYGANGSLMLLPTSQTYQTFYPTSYSVTATYDQIGNLNIPVSCFLSALPNAFNYSSPSGFVLGAGVSQVSVTLTKGACYNAIFSVDLSAKDFLGNDVSGSEAVTFVKPQPVTVVAVVVEGEDGYMNFEVYPSNDCGITWKYDTAKCEGTNPNNGPNFFGTEYASGGVTLTGLGNPYIWPSYISFTMSSPITTVTTGWVSWPGVLGPITILNEIY